MNAVKRMYVLMVMWVQIVPGQPASRGGSLQPAAEPHGLAASGTLWLRQLLHHPMLPPATQG